MPTAACLCSIGRENAAAKLARLHLWRLPSEAREAAETCAKSCLCWLRRVRKKTAACGRREEPAWLLSRPSQASKETACLLRLGREEAAVLQRLLPGIPKKAAALLRLCLLLLLLLS